MENDERLVMSVLIGTNNLGNAKHSVADAASGVIAVVTELLERTKGRVLLNALLPRGQKVASTAPEWRKSSFVSLMPAVRGVNALVNETVRGALEGRFPGRIKLVDCGTGMFLATQPGEQHWGSSKGGFGTVKGSSEVNISLMPDGLHPNARGTKLWTACLRESLEPWRLKRAVSAR